MKTEQRVWTKNDGWTAARTPGLHDAAQLVLAFGSTQSMSDAESFAQIRKMYPNAHVFGCSTAGEIHDTHVLDDSLVLTAVQLERTRIEPTEVRLADSADSFAAGKKLAGQLKKDGLVHVFVLSDGLQVNGSELVKGLTQNLPANVAVTGGLSGDGARFTQTLVCDGAAAESGKIAALGFYGDRLKVGYASMGGWDSFGPDRQVTKSKGNVLYELDGCSALELYKKYLGEHAADLPASGLLFPLSIRLPDSGLGLVRTILAVSEQDQSMTFAGDIPQGTCVRLMRANFDRLIDGASGAARTSYQSVGSKTPELAILISCVGRKLVLKQRVEEEVESVREILGKGAALTGFYSYGEISPFTPSAKCELHNQTMTITTFAEA